MSYVQGMKKLEEESILVRCRETDKSVVENLLEAARKQYADAVGEGAPELTLDSEFLKPPPTDKNNDPAFTW